MYDPPLDIELKTADLSAAPLGLPMILEEIQVVGVSYAGLWDIELGYIATIVSMVEGVVFQHPPENTHLQRNSVGYLTPAARITW